MALLLNNSVEETKIYSAYGLTVYGKVNRYVWTIYKEKDDNVLITIRITDAEENTIFFMHLENRNLCIFQSRIDDTMDNFLYWIVTEKPDTNTIEKQVLKSLCASDSLFNYLIGVKKWKAKYKEEEEKRIAERKQMEEKQLAEIKAYCKEKGFFCYVDYGEVTILKAITNNDRKMLSEAKDTERMQMVIDYVRKYPNNNAIKVVKEGRLEDIVNWIK